MLIQPSGSDLEGRIQELDEDDHVQEPIGKSHADTSDEAFDSALDAIDVGAGAGTSGSNGISTSKTNNKLLVSTQISESELLAHFIPYIQQHNQGQDDSTKHRNIIIIPRNRHPSDSSASSSTSSGSSFGRSAAAFVRY